MSGTAAISWPASRLGEALTALVRHASLTERPETAPAPPELLCAAGADQQEIINNLFQEASPDDGPPSILFISRLSQEQLEKAFREAFDQAHDKAEQLARASGKRLGELGNISSTGNLHHRRQDRMMNQQRCSAMLAGTGYELGEYESVSDNPRSAEFSVNVSVSYDLE